MTKIHILSLYPDQDIHCTNDVLGQFLYANGECILQGNYAEGIKEKITGALAMAIGINQKHVIKRKSIADGNLYFKYKDDPKKLYEKVFGEVEKSGYGQF